MSKLKCKCGHIIVDQTDDLPYKTHTFPNPDIDGLISILDHIDELISAMSTDNRNEWIRENFGLHAYELPNSALIYDLLLRKIVSSSGTIYTCENCKRLLVQEKQPINTLSTHPKTIINPGWMRYQSQYLWIFTL